MIIILTANQETLNHSVVLVFHNLASWT